MDVDMRDSSPELLLDTASSTNIGDDCELYAPFPDQKEEGQGPSGSNKGEEYKFSLDSLLQEREQQQKVNQEMEEINWRLATNTVITPKKTDLIQEQEEIMKKLELEDNSIEYLHPGVKLFHAHRYCCCFREGDLTMKTLGYQIQMTPNKLNGGQLWKMLKNQDAKSLQSLVSLGMFKRELPSKEIFSSVCGYLFYLMSIHSDEALVLACCDSLCYQLKEGGFTWCPQLKDVLAVFVNYGASLEDLCPKGFQGQLPSFCQASYLSPLSEEQQSSYIPVINIEHVVEFLALILSEHSSFTSAELDVLLYLLLMVVSSKQLRDQTLRVPFKNCIGFLLDCYTQEEWLHGEKIQDLAQLLLASVDHHHNHVFQCQILPDTVRGLHLQKALSYLVLQWLLHMETLDLVDIVVPCDVVEVLSKANLRDITDYYRLYSVITLIDLCIGSEQISANHRHALQEISDIVQKLYSELQESLHCLAVSEVKELMMQRKSKWIFMAIEASSVQSTLLRFLHRKNPRVSSPVPQQSRQISSMADDEGLPEIPSSSEVDELLLHDET